MTANGQTVIASMDAPDPDRSAPLDDGFPSLVEYSTRTGHVIRTLFGPPRVATPAGYGVAAIDPSGKYLLVAVPHFGRLIDGKFTPLVLKPGTTPTVAW